MAYVGGGVLPLRRVDVDLMCFMDICNIFEDELGYKDKGRMSYKFDDNSDEYIHGLTTDQRIMISSRCSMSCWRVGDRGCTYI